MVSRLLCNNCLDIAPYLAVSHPSGFLAKQGCGGVKGGSLSTMDLLGSPLCEVIIMVDRIRSSSNFGEKDTSCPSPQTIPFCAVDHYMSSLTYQIHSQTQLTPTVLWTTKAI